MVSLFQRQKSSILLVMPMTEGIDVPLEVLICLVMVRVMYTISWAQLDKVNPMPAHAHKHPALSIFIPVHLKV